METITVSVSIPNSLLAVAGLRELELDGFIRELVAIELYRQRRLSLGKAAEVAWVATKWEMTSALAKHDVWIDYTADDAVEDLATLRGVLRPRRW
jgi:predicted HTH domain antitoxin